MTGCSVGYVPCTPTATPTVIVSPTPTPSPTPSGLPSPSPSPTSPAETTAPSPTPTPTHTTTSTSVPDLPHLAETGSQDVTVTIVVALAVFALAAFMLALDNRARRRRREPTVQRRPQQLVHHRTCLDCLDGRHGACDGADCGCPVVHDHLGDEDLR